MTDSVVVAMLGGWDGNERMRVMENDPGLK